MPPPLAEEPAAPTGPRVVKEGAALRLQGLQGLPDPSGLTWAPGGQTAFVAGQYRLRLDTLELHPIADLGSYRLGWAGPDTALLLRWSTQPPSIGEFSLTTGEWHPLATVSGQVALCQGEAHWTWVEIQTVRSGGAGSREIGPVYRAPAPAPAGSGDLPPLTGKRVLERGALLGRLADGSCLLDGMDGRLLLLRPTGELQTLTDEFAIPEVTWDGQGVIWREQAGPCDYCIEVGPGMPFQRLVWWRLDGGQLTADLGRPQVIDYLLSPDGSRLVVGHRDSVNGTVGAISSLSADGCAPGKRQDPVRAPAGWMGATLLTQPVGPERWQAKSPVFREDGAEPAGQWLAGGADGSLLVVIDGAVTYLTPGGEVYRVSHPEPFLQAGQPIAGLNMSQPWAPYLAVLHGDGLLLAGLSKP